MVSAAPSAPCVRAERDPPISVPPARGLNGTTAHLPCAPGCLRGQRRESSCEEGTLHRFMASAGPPNTLGRFPCQTTTSALPHKLPRPREGCLQTKLPLMSLFLIVFRKSILPLQQHLLLLIKNVFTQFGLWWGLEGHKKKENFYLGNPPEGCGGVKRRQAALEAEARTSHCRSPLQP